MPTPPKGLLPESVKAWKIWFGAWYAGFWTPEDIPALMGMVQIYDQVYRGKLQYAGELRLQMESFGLTPKGRQDRRWKMPEEVRAPAPVQGAPYGKLKSVG